MSSRKERRKRERAEKKRRAPAAAVKRRPKRRAPPTLVLEPARGVDADIAYYEQKLGGGGGDVGLNLAEHGMDSDFEDFLDGVVGGGKAKEQQDDAEEEEESEQVQAGGEYLDGDDLYGDDDAGGADEHLSSNTSTTQAVCATLTGCELDVVRSRAVSLREHCLSFGIGVVRDVLLTLNLTIDESIVAICALCDGMLVRDAISSSSHSLCSALLENCVQAQNFSAIGHTIVYGIASPDLLLSMLPDCEDRETFLLICEEFGGVLKQNTGSRYSNMVKKYASSITENDPKSVLYAKEIYAISKVATGCTSRIANLHKALLFKSPPLNVTAKELRDASTAGRWWYKGAFAKTVDADSSLLRKSAIVENFESFVNEANSTKIKLPSALANMLSTNEQQRIAEFLLQGHSSTRAVRTLVKFNVLSSERERDVAYALVALNFSLKAYDPHLACIAIAASTACRSFALSLRNATCDLLRSHVNEATKPRRVSNTAYFLADIAVDVPSAGFGVLVRGINAREVLSDANISHSHLLKLFFDRLVTKQRIGGIASSAASFAQSSDGVARKTMRVFVDRFATPNDENKSSIAALSAALR